MNNPQLVYESPEYLVLMTVDGLDYTYHCLSKADSQELFSRTIVDVRNYEEVSRRILGIMLAYFDIQLLISDRPALTGDVVLYWSLVSKDNGALKFILYDEDIPEGYQLITAGIERVHPEFKPMPQGIYSHGYDGIHGEFDIDDRRYFSDRMKERIRPQYEIDSQIKRVLHQGIWYRIPPGATLTLP